jgi:prevent-host-death family protein
MSQEYPLYEAKAKLSALVRQVREGKSVIITVHGEPVAELRPIEKPVKKQTLAERWAELEAQGIITSRRQTTGKAFNFDYEVTDPVPGGLQRFLDERD